MKLIVILSGLAIVFILATTSTTFATNDSQESQPVKQIKKGKKGKKLVKDGMYYRISVDYHRQRSWYWQGVMFKPRHPTMYSERKAKGNYLRWLQRIWKKRHFTARARAAQPPHLNEWLCIHKYEGSWTDPNAPYYGGLQMDMSFQHAYGWNLLQKKGTADNWTPIEQMWVAEKAFASGRGFYPWPLTARYCGLL